MSSAADLERERIEAAQRIRATMQRSQAREAQRAGTVDVTAHPGPVAPPSLGEPDPYGAALVQATAAIAEALTVWLPRVATELRGIHEALDRIQADHAHDAPG